MTGTVLNSLSREALEAEILRLRAALNEAGVEADRQTTTQATRDSEHHTALDAGRAEAAQARQQTRDASDTHRRDMEDAAEDLAASRAQVSGLKANQADFIRSEARQRAIFESAIDFAMIVTNPGGLITDWNPGPAARRKAVIGGKPPHAQAPPREALRSLSKFGSDPAY